MPKGQPAVTRPEGIATVGVVLHLADVAADAVLTVDCRRRTEDGQSAAEGRAGRQDEQTLGGAAAVRLVTTATPVATDKTEDDFPAAAYGPDGTLWVAYIAYRVRDDSRRIEQKPSRSSRRTSRRSTRRSSPTSCS